VREAALNGRPRGSVAGPRRPSGEMGRRESKLLALALKGFKGLARSGNLFWVGSQSARKASTSQYDSRATSKGVFKQDSNQFRAGGGGGEKL